MRFSIGYSVSVPMLSRRGEIDELSARRFQPGQAGDNSETVSVPILLNPRLRRQMPGVGRQMTWRAVVAPSSL